MESSKKTCLYRKSLISPKPRTDDGVIYFALVAEIDLNQIWDISGEVISKNFPCLATFQAFITH